jgi:hypothetical protein
MAFVFAVAALIAISDTLANRGTKILGLRVHIL